MSLHLLECSEAQHKILYYLKIAKQGFTLTLFHGVGGEIFFNGVGLGEEIFRFCGGGDFLGISLLNR